MKCTVKNKKISQLGEKLSTKEDKHITMPLDAKTRRYI
jgi:hypothetical protein